MNVVSCAKFPRYSSTTTEFMDIDLSSPWIEIIYKLWHCNNIISNHKAIASWHVRAICMTGLCGGINQSTVAIPHLYSVMETSEDFLNINIKKFWINNPVSDDLRETYATMTSLKYKECTRAYTKIDKVCITTNWLIRHNNYSRIYIFPSSFRATRCARVSNLYHKDILLWPNVWLTDDFSIEIPILLKRYLAVMTFSQDDRCKILDICCAVVACAKRCSETRTSNRNRAQQIVHWMLFAE